MSTINLDNGKYTVTNDNGLLKFNRYGEEWTSGNNAYSYSGLVLALVHRVEELEETIQDMLYALKPELSLQEKENYLRTKHGEAFDASMALQKEQLNTRERGERNHE